MIRILFIFALSTLLALPAGAANIYVEPISNPIDNGVTLKLFPNPTPRYLNIDVTFPGSFESGSVEVRVKNMIGKEMVENVKQDMEGVFKTIEIDLEDLPAGIYLVDVMVMQNGSVSKTTRRITKL
jgi:hypothetical protein